MTRVLIVDDDPSIRQVVATLLTLEGFVVDTAPDGRAALDRILVSAPDIVLSDLRMPHMDGYGLLAAIRAHASINKLPFIFLSGTSDDESFTAPPGVKADAVLRKPFTRDALLSTVRKFTQA